MRYLVLAVFAVGSFVGSATSAAEQAIETFTPPERTKTVTPKYPKGSHLRGQEGWVRIALMIDPEGVPYDLTVIESSDREFERSAKRAVSQFRYAPAEFKGEKIDAGSAVRITYELSGPKGATRRFVTRQKRFHKAIESQDRDAADDALEELMKLNRNLYEEAFLNLSLFHYHAEWGTPEQQLEAVSRTTYMDGDRRFLPERTLKVALLRKVNLEARLGHYRSALKTAEQLSEFDLNDERAAALDKTVTAVREVMGSNKHLQRKGRIDDAYRFHHLLARSTFTFDEVEGAIAELRLHCDKAYVGMAYDPSMRYTVPKEFGDCRLTAIGDPDTTFLLTEYADQG